MPNGFARKFYMSPEWIRCRIAYAESKRWLCERCAEQGKIIPGTEVHHKIRLTRANINDPDIALCFDNLELLCKDCHLKEHDKRMARTDADGHADIDTLIMRRQTG